MALPVPPDPPATGVTDQLSWQQWDIAIRYQESVGYAAWLAADQAYKTANAAQVAAQTAAFQAQAAAMQAAAAASQASAAAISGPTPPAAPVTDAQLVRELCEAMLSDIDWASAVRPAAATVVSTARAVVTEYRKVYPVGT